MTATTKPLIRTQPGKPWLTRRGWLLVDVPITIPTYPYRKPCPEYWAALDAAKVLALEQKLASRPPLKVKVRKLTLKLSEKDKKELAEERRVDRELGRQMMLCLKKKGDGDRKLCRALMATLKRAKYLQCALREEL